MAASVFASPSARDLPVPPAQAVTSSAPIDRALWDRHRFWLRQKIAIDEKYAVWDDDQQPLLYIERPRNLFRAFLVLILTVGVGALAAIGGIWLARLVPPGTWRIGVALGSMAIGGGLGLTLLVALTRKRHVSFFRDRHAAQPVLTVLQDRKFFVLNGTYTVIDADGALLARLRKNYLYDLLRKRWYCYAPDGSLLCIAKEDSMVRALLRRCYGRLGWINYLVTPLLLTHFVIERADGGVPIGTFTRQMTLLDRYLLDMSADAGFVIDRRVALALAVMLDTGERR